MDCCSSSSHVYLFELFLYELRNTFCVHYPREFLSNYMLIVEFKQFISHCWSILISSASTTLYSFELVTIIFYLRAYTTLFMKFILACIDHAIFYICAFIFAYFAFELAQEIHPITLDAITLVEYIQIMPPWQRLLTPELFFQAISCNVDPGVAE